MFGDIDVCKLYEEARRRLLPKVANPYSVAVYPRLITAMSIVQLCGGLDDWDKMTERDKETAVLSIFDDMFWYAGDYSRLEDETEKTVTILQSDAPEHWSTLSVLKRSRMCITRMHDFLENSKRYHPDLIDTENFIEVFYREADFIYNVQADENYGEVKKDAEKFDEMIRYWDFSQLFEWFQNYKCIGFSNYEKAAFWRASEAVCETCKSQIKGLEQ